MYTLLLLGIGLLVVYLVWQNGKLRAALVQLSAQIGQNPKEIKTADIRQEETLGYEWFEDGWPYQKSEDEDDDRGPEFELQNPKPYEWKDRYSIALLLSEYDGAASQPRRKCCSRRFKRQWEASLGKLRRRLFVKRALLKCGPLHISL